MSAAAKRPSDDAQGGPKGKRTKPTEDKFHGVEVSVGCPPYTRVHVHIIKMMNIKMNESLYSQTKEHPPYTCCPSLARSDGHNRTDH